MKGRYKKKSNWYKILIVCFFLILSILLYSRYIATTVIVVKENIIKNQNLPNEFYGYKIIQLSDIHYKTTIGRVELNKIIKKTNKSKPDIIIISGDLLDSNSTYTDNDINNLVKILSKLECKHKYIIKGEDDNNEVFDKIIDKIDFKLLDNSYDVLYNNNYEPIIIGGISSCSDGKPSIDKLNTINEGITKYNSKYNILIIHEPSIIKEINYNNFQLVLAGHTHNGQVNLPFIKNFFMPDSNNMEFTKTYYKYDNTDLYISPGLGTSNVKARLFNRPTINLYRLSNK